MRAVRGTLRTLTPEEAAYFGNESAPATPGEQLLISAAAEALSCWPPPSSMEEFLLFMRGIYLALKAALALDAAGALLMPAQRLNRELQDSLKILFEGTFGASPDAPRTLRALRSLDDDGLSMSRADEEALRRLGHRLRSALSAEWVPQWNHAGLAVARERAAADVARHGLRRCVLPSCGAQEAHPKLFKLCGRCRGAAYCCAAHGKEDWKRHKRDDGCSEVLNNNPADNAPPPPPG